MACKITSVLVISFRINLFEDNYKVNVVTLFLNFYLKIFSRAVFSFSFPTESERALSMSIVMNFSIS